MTQITLADVMAEVEAAEDRSRRVLDEEALNVARAAAAKSLPIEWLASRLREAGYKFREKTFRTMYNEMKKESTGDRLSELR